MKIKYLSILSVLFLIVENNGFTMDGIYDNDDNITEYDEDDFTVIDKKSNNNKKKHNNNNSNTLRRANYISDNDADIEEINDWVNVGEYKTESYSGSSPISDGWISIEKTPDQKVVMDDEYNPIDLSNFQDDDVSVLDNNEDNLNFLLDDDKYSIN